MKIKILISIICITCCIFMHAQSCDTLTYGGYKIILNTEEFGQPIIQRDEECGELSRQYVYLRKYEQPQKYPSSYILILMLPPVSEFDYHTFVETHLYYEGKNPYGGKTQKYHSDDGLYFRYDTYGGYFSKIKVMYDFVRAEDLELFDSIMNNVIIQPNE